jgi:hypothetical protein
VAAALAGRPDGPDRAGGVVLFLFTRDTRYLQFSWRLFRYSLVVALLVFALMIIERVAVIPV